MVPGTNVVNLGTCWNNKSFLGGNMDDGIRGSIIIIIIDFTLAVIVSLIREKQKGTNLKNLL